MSKPVSSVVAEQSCEFCGEFFPLRAERNLHKCPFFNPSPVAQQNRVAEKNCDDDRWFDSNHEEPGCNDSPRKSTTAFFPKSLVKPSNFRLSLKAGQIDLKPTYECEFCLSILKQKFTNLDELNVHYEKCHSVSRKELMKKRKFLSERINDVSSNSSSTISCPSSTTNNSTSFDGYLQCTKCQKFFNDSDSCRKHVIDVHLPQTERNNKLSISDWQQFVRKGFVKEEKPCPLESDAQERTFSQNHCSDCTECGAKFHEKSDLFDHVVKVHNRKVLYECSICSMIFLQRLTLNRHMQSHKSVDNTLLPDRIFECEFCGKQFMYESYYKRHLATHVGTKIFTCDICGDDCQSQSRLVLHKAGHVGDERFRCYKCNKQFAYKSMLQRHVHTHAGDLKPCEYCGKMFAIQSLLEKHISLVHMEVHQLSCPYCHKRFLYPSYLERHIATHKSSKEHACPMCSRTFNQRNTLLAHLQSHLPSFLETQKPYPCPVNLCNRSFKSESVLQRHLEKAHCIDRATASTVMAMTSSSSASAVEEEDDATTGVVSVVGDDDNAAVEQNCDEFYFQNPDGSLRQIGVQTLRDDDGQEYFAIPVMLKDSDAEKSISID